MALASLALTGAVEISVTSTSARTVLPSTGSPTTALLNNLGPAPVFVLLGDNTVVVTIANGAVVMPGVPLALTIGAATNIAAIALSGAAGLNVAVGT